jgi:hypothetical protein
MGNTGAKFFGLPEAFVEVADSVAGILKRVRVFAKLLRDAKDS